MDSKSRHFVEKRPAESIDIELERIRDQLRLSCRDRGTSAPRGRVGGSEKERKGDATRPWSRRAMSVSARARGHLVVARVTEQQQGMADEVVFHACPFDFVDGKSLAVAKAGFFDRL